MTPLEIAANLSMTVSIVLAARNSLHTWWIGIVGCALFGWLFMRSQLYADATLQALFIASSAWGWWHWRGEHGEAAPIARTPASRLLALAAAAALLTLAYGSLLKHWTDAFAPFIDSAVLAFSLVAQLLLMQRRLESWPAWLIVNTLSVPLYFARGLTLTAAVYALYWFNAWYGWWRWRRVARLAVNAGAR